jgi:hypothetical protein
MPRHLREGREAYGQVESHVRQVYNGTVGWFDGEVYDINPLSLREEAERTVEMMGGRDTVRKAAGTHRLDHDFANWLADHALDRACLHPSMPGGDNSTPAPTIGPESPPPHTPPPAEPHRPRHWYPFVPPHHRIHQPQPLPLYILRRWTAGHPPDRP